MLGTERVKEWFDGKTNNSPKAKKIKKELELLGHTDVHVWWEPIGTAAEMCGNEGGYYFASDQSSINGLGYSFDEAMDLIKRASWLRVN